MKYREYCKKFSVLLFPNLRFLGLLEELYARFRKEHSQKMRLPVKIAIGSGVTLVVIVIFGWIAFPKILKSQIRSQVALKPKNEIRDMYLKVPFPLDFKVYMFNVTNYLEVTKGDVPVLDEIGPYFYDEWKEKVDIEDNEEDDTMTYRPKNTFFFNKEKSGRLTGDEVITIPNPMIVGVALAVAKSKPALLTLLNKALTEIHRKPETPFLTATVRDILFDGFIINCTVTDFAAKTVCTTLKTESSDLVLLSDTVFKYSLFGGKNGTAGKRIKVYRGIKNANDLGKVVEFDDKPDIGLWTTDECNKFEGTDSTIFPPFLSKKDGLVSFSPEICRVLPAEFDSDTMYQGLPVRKYSADFGDMSSNPEQKCYCDTPDTCLKKGVMDIFKCVKGPIVVSLPHFYLADKSYQEEVRGLRPKKEDHEIIILFESMTGTPVYAKKRLQFNMPLMPLPKIAVMKNLPTALFPLFWVEEGVELNTTFTKQINDQLFRTLKMVKVAKWSIVILSLAGFVVAGFLHFKQNKAVTITPVNSPHVNNTVGEPQKNVISMLNTSDLTKSRNRTNTISLSGQEFEKY